MSLKPKRTSVQAPWQNGIAERWIGSCRRELLDHVIALGESHLRGLIRDYVNYHHEDRIHDSLQKDTPNQRAVISAERARCSGVARTERRIRSARFPVLKSLETFEYSLIPSLNKSLVLELARCEYIDRKRHQWRVT